MILVLRTSEMLVVRNATEMNVFNILCVTQVQINSINRICMCIGLCYRRALYRSL